MRDVRKEMVEQIIVSFQRAQTERRELFELHWKMGGGEPDLLLEAELYGDAVVGLSSHVFSRRGPASPVEVRAKLGSSSLFLNGVLTKFVLTQQGEFPNLHKHLLLVECLRSACLVALSVDSQGRPIEVPI